MNNGIDLEKPDFMDADKGVKEYVRDLNIHSLVVLPIGGGSPLIRAGSVKISHGHRYGLIGYNGAGKTTLLRKLADGSIPEIPRYLRILHVHQEMEGNDETVMDTVLKSDREREYLLAKERHLRKIFESFATDTKEDDEDKSNENGHSKESETENKTTTCEDNEKKELSDRQEAESLDKFEEVQRQLEELHDRLKYIDSDTAEGRASEVLDGLQFTDRMKHMKTKDLSGGWLMRVSLACALFIEPDILLLDEPTNHLDFPSVVWLSEYLETYPDEKTVVIVSHDRRFLNDTCTDIIHLDRGRLFFYAGNYDSFLEIRKQTRIHTRKQYERQQAMIRHNEEFIARFKANKKWSTQAQSRQKLLNRVARIEKVLDDLEFRFEFPQPAPLKNPNIVQLHDVSFGYFGEDPSRSSYLLDRVALRLVMGTKVGILGANGAGKSTLVRLIMNELKPLHGTCALLNQCEVGFFAQHHVETLDFNATPLQHLKNVFGQASIQEIYAQLGRFSLGGATAKQRIGTLSGGQKSRVAFAILTWYRPHLIIMDEPTNHLDMPTIDALAVALSDFEGSVLLVSHDQHFLETVCDEYWAVGNRTVKVFDDFRKCRSYSFKKCKPVDVLPRELSSIEVKKRKYRETAPVDGIDLSRTGSGGFNSGFDPSGTSSSSTAKGKGNGGKGKKKPVLQQAAIIVDAEREIDKGLAKGLTPNQIHMHVKGYKPVDGVSDITNKLGFIMFHDYFDKMNTDVAPLEFFERWHRLVSYCIPMEHLKNQHTLVDIAYACFATANRDKKGKAKGSYSLGMIIESMLRSEILNVDALNQWYEKNETKIIQQFRRDIPMAIEAIEEDDDDDSESSS